MKRQLTSILLFSALLMGGASTFVSCTDHESDAAYSAQGSISDELNKQATELANKIKALEDAINGDGSSTGSTGIKGQIANLETQLTQKEQALREIITGNKTATDAEIANLRTDISTLQGAIAQANSDIAGLQTQINNANAAIEAAKAAAIAAAKDYTDTKVAEAAATAQTNLNEAVARLQSQISSCHTECKAYTDDKVSALQEIIDGLDEQLAEYSKYITQLYQLYGDLDARVLQDSALIAEVNQGVIDLNTAVNNLNTKLDSKVDTSDFKAVKAQVEANKALANQNKADIDSIKAKLVDYVTKADLDNKAAELQTAFENADTALKSEIQAKIDTLQTQLNSLFNAMVNMITGIELQATESPISGYENLSFLGVEAHILGSYYGTSANTCKIGNEIINKDELLIDDESGENAGIVYATINPSNKDFTGTTLKIVDSQGNEAPFTATVVKSNKVLKYGISRATGNKSNLYAIKINLDKSNLDAAKTWTSSDATALKDVAKNVLDKLRKPSTNRLNLGEVASTIASTFNNRLTAYALEAEQEITDGKNTEVRTITSKLSLAATAIKPLSYNFLKYNATLNNLDLPSFPTIQSKINFNDYKFNWTPIEGLGTIKTSVTLKGMPDLDAIKVKIDGKVAAPKVEVEKATVTFGTTELEGTVDETTGKVTIDLSKLQENTTADVEVSVGDVVIKDGDIKITLDTSATKDASYDVEIPMDEFNKIIESINSQVGNMIGSVNDIVDQVNGYAETIDGKYITKINNFIQKFENLLRKSNSLLQPAMFYVTSEGSWGQLAREAEGAAYLKLNGGTAATTFVASSYTGELLAPAYKKCITVVSKPEGATVSGDNLGKVISGNVSKIGFKANKAGTYGLKYEAVDYSGVKVEKTFYVKVVK